MITLTLGEIFKGKDALNKLTNLQLPAKKAYKLTKFLREVKKEFDTIEEVRIKLVQQYGEPDNKGNITILDQEKLLAFNNQFTELLLDTREFNMDKFNIDDFGNAEFSPNELSLLNNLIDED